jgi:inorganic pyrophosphatase
LGAEKNLDAFERALLSSLRKKVSTLNLWRDIPVGENPPEKVNVVIEVNIKSRAKYEYDVRREAFVLDRVLHSSTVFPVEYGFIPQTWFIDNDPLDIMVLSYAELHVGCIIEARPIGALIMEDEKGEDSKILSVPIKDSRFDGYQKLSDVPPSLLKEIQEFFETYKRLESSKWVKIKTWKEAEEARKIVKDAMELYRITFGTRRSR